MRIVSWNIGYAGMGKEAEMHYEGGLRIIPSTHTAVQKNIAGITNLLHTLDAEVYLLQEVSTGSPLNYFENTLAHIQKALPTHTAFFVPQFSLPLLPARFAWAHGIALFVHKKHAPRFIAHTFHTHEYYYHFIPRHTVYIEAMLPHLPLRIATTHLPAYDTDAHIRTAHCKELAHLLDTTPTIIGADWNMALHKPREEHPYERVVFPVPREVFPQGWQWHVDTHTPTIRRAEKPWDGSNQTAFIDGFVSSPGITGKIETYDQHFEWSDHNPVIFTVT